MFAQMHCVSAQHHPPDHRACLVEALGEFRLDGRVLQAEPAPRRKLEIVIVRPAGGRVVDAAGLVVGKPVAMVLRGQSTHQQPLVARDPHPQQPAYLVMLRSDRSTTNPSAETFSLQRSMPPGLSALPHRSKNRTTSSAVGREERGRSRVILKQYLNNNAQIHALQPRPGPSDECIPNQATLAHPRILTHRR